MFFCCSLSRKNRQSTSTMFVSAPSGSKSAYISPRYAGTYFLSFLSLRDFDISTSWPKTPPPKPCCFLGLCVQNVIVTSYKGLLLFSLSLKSRLKAPHVCAAFSSYISKYIITLRWHLAFFSLITEFDFLPFCSKYKTAILCSSVFSLLQNSIPDHRMFVLTSSASMRIYIYIAWHLLSAYRFAALISHLSA